MPLAFGRQECAVTRLLILVLGVLLLEDQSLTCGASTTFGVQKMVKTCSLLRLFQPVLSAINMALGSLFSLVIPSFFFTLMILSAFPKVSSSSSSQLQFLSMDLGAGGGGGVMYVLGPAQRGEVMKRSDCFQIFWEHSSECYFVKCLGLFILHFTCSLLLYFVARFSARRWFCILSQKGGVKVKKIPSCYTFAELSVAL